ncbi:MAG: hypothetical protein IJK39_07525, partial [Bacteroidales bacterium]|nr:hypothetical protein [Bacteroidales bacterium]
RRRYDGRRVYSEIYDFYNTFRHDTYQDAQSSRIPQQGYNLGADSRIAPINCIFVISMLFGKTKPNLYE